jgi:hypothetical protein
MKLIICGNGFDIHHKLNTQYKNYQQYLLEKEPTILEKLSKIEYFDFGLDTIKEKGSVFWTDVENNLFYDFIRRIRDLIEKRLSEARKKASEMSLEAILDDKTEEPPINLDLYGTGATALQSFSGLALYRWLKTIDLTNIQKDNQLHLDANDFFITFNYTDTLEQIYDIPNDHLFHIHGRLNDVHTPQTDLDVHSVLQFGNPNIDINLIPIYLEQIFMESDLAYQPQKCIEEMRCFFSLFTKDLKSNAEKLKSFIGNNKFDEIIIMGHSYLGVDKYYYNEILIPFYRKAKWTIYCHNDETIISAKRFFREHKLSGSIKEW